MRYAVFFTWEDGFKDSFNCENAEERDLNIKDMFNRKEFIYIAYEKIYQSGEHGKRIAVLDTKKG